MNTLIPENPSVSFGGALPGALIKYDARPHPRNTTPRAALHPATVDSGH